jgi:hypothetical protein
MHQSKRISSVGKLTVICQTEGRILRNVPENVEWLVSSHGHGKTRRVLFALLCICHYFVVFALYFACITR